MRFGFTLIELLVVITIIVVLLALSTPALDKAIYEAEMVVDMANMRGIATAANAYAMSHKRSYPYREDARGTNASSAAMFSAAPYSFASPNNIRDTRADIEYDLRPKMRDYWTLKQAVSCPFSDEVDLTDDGTTGNTMISSDYNLFFGWRYEGRSPMYRLGDRLGVANDIRSTVLVSDVDSYDKDNNASWASHPDSAGILGAMVWQNFGDAGRGAAPGAAANAAAYGALIGDPNFSWTWSRWDSRAGTVTWDRGAIDDNFAFADGSAERYNQILVDQADDRQDPFTWGWVHRAGGGSLRLILPKR